MELAIVIMAAGKGTRLKSKRPKVLHEIGGKALLLHVIEAAKQVAAPGDIYVIVGHQAEQVRAAVAHTGVQFVEQTEQRGTGHAIESAAPTIRPYRNLLVLSGDVPLLKASTITALRDYHLAEDSAMTILTAEPTDPTGYGRIHRRSPSSDEVEAIVEQKALGPELLHLCEINTGIYAFATEPLLAHLPELEANNAHGELYLTDMASLLVQAGERVLALPLGDGSQMHEVLGANTIAEMMELDKAVRRETVARLMAAGVTVFQPETVIVDAGVKVGADTVLEPWTQLLGRTRVGERCRIRSYSVIENTTLGDDVLVRHGCVFEDSEVGSGTILGPYAHLRPASVLRDGAHVGNFVELKNATLGERSKANHLTYLGDATIGAGVNIGAGTIICNYDGVHKHHTEIGDEVFVGSDSVLVAPVKVGDRAYIAAASCVTDEVPADALALGRARQVNKEGWARRKREAAQTAGTEAKDPAKAPC